jgi:hypothetical protein
MEVIADFKFYFYYNVDCVFPQRIQLLRLIHSITISFSTCDNVLL